MPIKLPLSAALFICLSLTLSQVAAAAPRIIVEQPVFDFGTVRQGRKVDHNFVVRNRGDAPLVIEKTRSSCGCTVANVTARSIPPGSSGEIKITFDSANFAGKIEKTIALDVNDPQTPTTTLVIRGVITEELVISPRQLNLGTLKGGTSRDATISIENRGDRPVRLTGFTSSAASLVVKGKPAQLQPGQSASITVTAAPRSEDRYLNGNIIVATDNQARPNIIIPVFGSVAR